MSIRWMRSAVIANGKLGEALAWSKEVAAYVEKKHNVKIDTWLDAFGTMGAIRWTIEFPDLATVDKVQMQILGDQEYFKYLEKAGKSGYLLEGQTTDVVLRKI